jgi:lysophospholipid acyltransferase (LPLAT)-like uncharacterized protein
VSERTDWRISRVKRLQAAAIAALGYPLVALLGRTFRWHVEGREHLDAVERSGRPPIMAFWHGRILPSTVFFQRRGIVVLTSENFDGEWIARIITRFGYGTARGSTSRGAVRGLVQLRRDMAAGRPAGFTVDGPRGPALKVQPGAAWLAKATGSPLVPFHIEAERFWTARSWDRTQVPRPFSRLVICIGEPLYVESTADQSGIEEASLRLERALLALMARAQALVASGAPGRTSRS